MSATAARSPSPAPAGELTGREVRRLTRQLTASEGGASVTSVLGDAYTAVLVVAISLGLALGLANAIGVLAPATGGSVAVANANAVLPWLLAALAVAGLGSIAARFGPVGADSAEVHWWLSTPADRRGLLRPRAWQAIGLGGALLAVGSAAVLLIARVPVAAGPYLLAAAGGLGLGAGLVAALALLELQPAARRRAALGFDIALLAAPLLAAAWAFLAPPSPPTAPPLAIAIALAALAAGTAIAADRHVERLRVRVMHQAGTAMGAAISALRSLDTRQLSRALTEPLRVVGRRRTSRLLVLARGPISASVIAEAIEFGHAPRRWLQLLLAGAAAMLVSLVTYDLPALVARLVVATGIIAGGYLAALTCVQPAREAFETPALDTIYGLAPRTARLTRLILPTALVLAWAAAVGASLGALLVEPALLLVLLAAGPALAAAALRAAYRDPPDFSGPLLVTPMGSYPPGMFAVLLKGPDVAMLACLPFTIAIMSALPMTALAPLQLAASAIAVVAAINPGKRSPG